MYENEQNSVLQLFTKVSAFSQKEQYGVETQHVLPKIMGPPEMSNFDICVMHLGIGAILGDPKFGAIHIGSPHCITLAGYT